MEKLEYKGSRFGMEEVNGWYRSVKPGYRIVLIEAAGEQLWLPPSYRQKPVIEWQMKDPESWYEKKPKRERFPNVKLIRIPSSIEKIDIENDLFPELETVQIDPANTAFCTDGKMIFTADKRDLLYCPVCRGERIEIPEEVREIGDGAFSGTAYEEIRFPKHDLKLHSRALENSKWLETQGDTAVVGSVLYHIRPGMECLNVPEGVKRFHPKLFDYQNVPEKINLPFFPMKQDIERLNGTGVRECRSVTFTSSRSNINIAALRKWNSLREVVIAGQDKACRTQDGIVYSRDGSVLVWYPSGRHGTAFAVPEGVKKIGEYAFANQKYLKKLVLPDSVRTIGTCAFFNCGELEELHFPPNIKELPDSSAYQRGGVCEGCTSLKHVVLPKKLEYLGSYAFYDSGLESVVLNEGLEQIGEYALMSENLDAVSLPASVKRVGKGSLYYVESAEAYEGTAKGLVAAVNTVPPDTKDRSANVEWGRCEVTVRRRRSEKKDFFLIPGSLKKSAAYHLDMAWNGDKVDYMEYGRCLGEITDPDEKLEFAEQGLLRHQEEENIYMDYMRKVSYKMGIRLLEKGKEKEFLAFVKRDFLTENALSKLLKCSNQNGMTVCSAYLVEILNKKRKKTTGFRI